MPGGRPRKADKLTNAERARRFRKKRKQDDPDGFKENLLFIEKSIMTRSKTIFSLGSRLRQICCYLTTRKNKRKNNS